MGAEVFCGDCGHRFDDYDAANRLDDQGQRVLACPECGSLKRHFTASVSETIGVQAHVGGVAIGYVAGWREAATASERVAAVRAYSPRWIEQWWTLLRSRDVLADVYGGRPENNVWVSHAVQLGCLASQWLREHLDEPAEALRELYPRLGDAEDLANSHKHVGRDPRYRVGRVLSYESGAAGPTLSVAFAGPDSTDVEIVDAMELLDGCVAAWQDYFDGKGIVPPPLP